MPINLTCCRAILLVLAFSLGTACCAEPPGTNYEESKVPAYTLPDPLLNLDGTKVEDAAAWKERRSEILELFRNKREVAKRHEVMGCV